MAVYIVCAFWYIVEVCMCRKNVLADVDTSVSCVFFCSKYIVISNCSVYITGKDWCYSVSGNFYVSNHCLTYFSSFFNDVEFYCLASCVVLAGSKSFDCYSSFASFFIVAVSYLIICAFYQFDRTIHYCNGWFNLFACSNLIFNRIYCYVSKILSCYIECNIVFAICRIY